MRESLEQLYTGKEVLTNIMMKKCTGVRSASGGGGVLLAQIPPFGFPFLLPPSMPFLNQLLLLATYSCFALLPKLALFTAEWQ